MLLDTALNTLATVLSTLYQNFLESAMKFYRYAKSMGSRRQPPGSLLISKSAPKSKELLLNLFRDTRRDYSRLMAGTGTIHDLSDLAFALIQSKHESHKAVEYQCGVTNVQIEW